MLKVSSLFILLCGLLASSSAQEDLSRIASQITNALTQGLLGMNVLSTLQTIDFQGSLKNVFSLARSHQSILGGLLTNRDTNLIVQMKDLRLLQVSLENSPNFKEVDLRIPLAFSIQIKFPALNPCIFHVWTDMKVQLYLEKDIDSRYQLAFGHCRIAPDTVWIQSENFVTPMKKNIVENIERILGDLIIHNLGAKMCPFINSCLYDLNPQVTKELISLLLQQGKYHATIQISPK
ncbi:putative BPIFA4P protein [Vulpes vulpes]|uniref:BPIFA4P protein n=1 Tax=Vulpes vulpes TaxID=9627 RepID=A0ABM4YLX3_VULVU